MKNGLIRHAVSSCSFNEINVKEKQNLLFSCGLNQGCVVSLYSLIDSKANIKVLSTKLNLFKVSRCKEWHRPSPNGNHLSPL